MSRLADLFDEYCSEVQAMGASDVALVAGPAPEGDLARLSEYLDGEVPDQLVEWYRLCNGPTSPSVERDAPMLFPWWISYPLDFLLDNIGWLSDRFQLVEGGPTLERPFPVLLGEGTRIGMWMECANLDGRLVYCGNQEFGGAHDGYYHDSPADFVSGCLANLRAGHYEARHGGVAMPVDGPIVKDRFHNPISFWAAGFQKENGLPPRLPWPTSEYDGVDLNVPWDI